MKFKVSITWLKPVMSEYIFWKVWQPFVAALTLEHHGRITPLYGMNALKQRQGSKRAKAGGAEKRGRASINIKSLMSLVHLVLNS